jgi:hypothetical protein
MAEKEDIYKLNEAIEKFINEDIIPFTSGDFQKMVGVKSLKDVDGNIVPWTSYFDDLIDDSAVNEFLLFLQTAGDVSLSERDTRQIGRFLWDAKTNPDALKGFALNKNKVDNVGHLVWSTIQTQLPHFQASFVKLGQPDDLTPLGDNLVKYFNIPDTPTNVVGNEFVDNYGKTTTGFIDDLPLEKPVKDVFLNAANSRVKKLGAQVASPGGILDTIDIYEMAVLSLVAGAIAYNEIDEIPKIVKNAILRTHNLSQGRPIDAPLRIIGLPVLSVSEYDIDFEYAMETLEQGEKVMPTEIAIDYVQEKAEEFEGESTASGYAYMTPSPKNTDTMETTQKIQPGVQEEKMFEKLRPKKTKSSGGSGAKIL